MRIPLGLAAVLGLCLTAGCETKGPTEAEPVPGTLTVMLATPYPDDRAALINVSGPGPISELQPGFSTYTMRSRTTDAGTRVVLFGALSNGALLRFNVPDVNQISRYSASLDEVADAQNSLRSSTAGYSVTVQR